MSSLDIWMRENPLAYVWLGSYAVALLIFVVEIVMVMHKRKITLQQLRMMREAEDEANGHDIYATPDDKTCHARFPHPIPHPEGEGTNEPLRGFQVKENN